MKYQEVLREWRICKEKVLNDKKLLEETNDYLLDMTFSCNGLSVKETPCQVLESLKKSLPNIIQNCQKLRNKYTSAQFGIHSSQASYTYTIYIGLVETYKKIIEYYNRNQSGPNIEEVD